MNKLKKLLFVAPHPDDEVLGCGGIIKKYSEKGYAIYVLIVSRGKEGLYSEAQIKNVRKEAKEAHAILGVNETVFLDFPAPELDTVSISEIARAINKVILRFKPHTIYLPNRGDIHHDHRIVFDAGLVASRPVNDCPIRHILSYETLSETEWSAPFSGDVFVPDHFVNISQQIKHKLEAFKCFKSQIHEFPNPRSLKTIEALAAFRGATVGFHSAEAFKVIRNIEE